MLLRSVEDDDWDHLDFERDDHIEEFCRERLNRVGRSNRRQNPKVTQRTLSVVLLEMRRCDVDREGVLPPNTMDDLFERWDPGGD